MKNSKRQKRKGNVWMAAGLLLIAAAFFLAVYNLWDDNRASRASKQVLEQLRPQIEENMTAEADDSQEAEVPDYILYPDMEMPVADIGGQQYIGILEIPAMNLSLPVMSEWSYSNFKTAPCRYKGSVYKRNLIIAGHNYVGHFGELRELPIGETMIFIDVSGNRFQYEVTGIEILEKTAVEEMEAGDWDMTVFTCTYGARQRVTVRCRLKNET